MMDTSKYPKEYRERDVDTEKVLKWYDNLTEEEKAEIREQFKRDKERLSKIQINKEEQ